MTADAPKPGVLIFLGVEEKPAIGLMISGRGEFDRLADWLGSHPGYLALLQYAASLAQGGDEA